MDASSNSTTGERPGLQGRSRGARGLRAVLSRGGHSDWPSVQGGRGGWCWGVGAQAVPFPRDSYWVMEGLLLSEMPQTVKGMLQNFLDLVRL